MLHTEDVSAQLDCQLLKAPRVAELLDISKSKAYSLMQSGELPTIRMGRNLRVPAKALRRWIDDNTRPGLIT
jgi:excisionase family DNA binding protein